MVFGASCQFIDLPAATGSKSVCEGYQHAMAVIDFGSDLEK